MTENQGKDGNGRMCYEWQGVNEPGKSDYSVVKVQDENIRRHATGLQYKRKGCNYNPSILVKFFIEGESTI